MCIAERISTLIISNSEADAYLQCRRLHYYKHALGLYPRKLSRANHIGLLGHHILETYYRSIKDGSSKAVAFADAMVTLSTAFGHEEPEIIDLISTRMRQYHEYYKDDDDFQIVDVEGVYRAPLNSNIELGTTLDLLVYYNSGPWAGQYVVIDHKFKYNFLTADEMSMHAQTYKYIWVLRQNGFNIRRSIINQIRYRDDLKDINKIFRRVEGCPTDAQIDGIINEHRKVAEEIYEHKTSPVAWYADNAPRRMNSRDCAGCYFRIPCRQELLGLDASRTLSSMFAPEEPHTLYRQYGY